MIFQIIIPSNHHQQIISISSWVYYLFDKLHFIHQSSTFLNLVHPNLSQQVSCVVVQHVVSILAITEYLHSVTHPFGTCLGSIVLYVNSRSHKLEAVSINATVLGHDVGFRGGFLVVWPSWHHIWKIHTLYFGIVLRLSSFYKGHLVVWEGILVIKGSLPQVVGRIERNSLGNGQFSLVINGCQRNFMDGGLDSGEISALEDGEGRLVANQNSH